ncbi:MAG: flagellin lysine-N-methylase [Lachnospiraceae bacterium]|nr:flagellin lysine-N-methylase [Lachnospiraceae bacterium]
MLIRKQNGFDDFVCIADRCPKSCCIGWQIVIDDKSMQKYGSITGDFADELNAGIDPAEKCFRRIDTRCAMLDDDGLCRLQKALGGEYLCDTCRIYPRHEEEFLDLREETLTLSCPEAARMLLDGSYTFGFTEEENEEADDPGEFGDCDPFLLDELAYSREKMAEFIKNRKIPFQKRLSAIGAAAFDMQRYYDRGETEMIGAACEGFYDEKTLKDMEPVKAAGIPMDHSYALFGLSFLSKLEVLEDSWPDIISKTIGYFSGMDGDCAGWKDAADPEKSGEEAAFEKLFLAFLYTYLCGSVYDGQIYARCMIAIWSVRFIMLLFAANDLSLTRMICLFAREIEHSDENITALISFFEAELPDQ